MITVSISRNNKLSSMDKNKWHILNVEIEDIKKYIAFTFET